jgi:hypothetical protein
MKTSKPTLKLIPFKYLIATTEIPDSGLQSLAESATKAVHVKRKLTELYRSLNTGGISLPFNVMDIANIIDKLIEKIGTQTTDGKIELTLLSDTGVKWLNEVNEIVKETKSNHGRKSEFDDFDEIQEQLVNDLLLWED